MGEKEIQREMTAPWKRHFFFLESDLNRLQLRDKSSPNSTCSIEGSYKVLEEPGHSLDA